MIKVLTSSTQDTIRLGKLFSKNLKEKDVIVLSGVLGAGKTTFVKGILEGFRATSVAQSPSFTLVRRYRIKNLSRRDKTAAFRPRMEAWSGFLPARMGYRKPRGLLARGASYIYHIDLYRLEKTGIFDFGIEDYLYAKGTVALIEWGEKIEKYLPSYTRVKLSFSGENSRKITFGFKNYPSRSLARLIKALEIKV